MCAVTQVKIRGRDRADAPISATRVRLHPVGGGGGGLARCGGPPARARGAHARAIGRWDALRRRRDDQLLSVHVRREIVTAFSCDTSSACFSISATSWRCIDTCACRCRGAAASA